MLSPQFLLSVSNSWVLENINTVAKEQQDSHVFSVKTRKFWMYSSEKWGKETNYERQELNFRIFITQLLLKYLHHILRLPKSRQIHSSH